MKRLILAIPEALNFSELSQVQQSAIQAELGQFVSPMPGTVAFGGKKVVDAVTGNDFVISRITELGLPFEVLAEQTFDGETIAENFAMDEVSFLNYLPMPEEGEKVFKVPHTWAGWPT